MKKRSANWVHYSFGGHVPMLERNDKGETTLCGKTARRIRATRIKTGVTCVRCIERLKEDNWFCEEHGYIADENVRNDETCDICGREVG